MDVVLVEKQLEGEGDILCKWRRTEPCHWKSGTAPSVQLALWGQRKSREVRNERRWKE